MNHYAAQAVRDRLLFTTHAQVRRLWCLLNHYAPAPIAGFIMPNHVHWFHPHDVREALHIAMSAYARLYNHECGVSGRLWLPLGEPAIVVGRKKVRRHVRYIALNGCRAGLHGDPLSWSWTTHRDVLGLAVPRVRSLVADPYAHHAYVSADPSVHVEGSDLPSGPGRPLTGLEGLRAVEAAVSEITRHTFAQLRIRGPVRLAFIRSARAHTTCSTREIADFVGVSARTVRRVEVVDDPVVRAVGQVLLDPRFPGLHDGDLRRERGWRRYRR